jgi:wobble nucleotide-excising tRNase
MAEIFDTFEHFNEVYTMMNIACDDGSTNVKLAWIENGEIKTHVSQNAFREGWATPPHLVVKLSTTISLMGGNLLTTLVQHLQLQQRIPLSSSTL